MVFAFHLEVLFFGHRRGLQRGVDDQVLLPGPVLVVMGPDVLSPAGHEPEPFLLILLDKRSHGGIEME